MEQEEDEDDQKNCANASHSTVAITIAIAAEASAKTPGQEDDEDDDQDQAQRHVAYPFVRLTPYDDIPPPCWQRGDMIPAPAGLGTLHVRRALEALLSFSGEPMRSLLLWLIGIPIPIIIILWLITGHA